MQSTTETIALLGPTNTGKTHRAVTRMLEHQTGMIGLPLRLLAREVYDRVSAQVGEERVALVTGEERRIPKHPAYFVATTEAMPVDREVEFLCVDEVQLAVHPERGHVVTERLLHARGTKETWFLGSHTMRRLIAELVPTAKFQEHPRLSRLRFSDAETQSRVPKRSAIVAFSAADVYETAERLRRGKGGAAVVMGSLSPRARNAQVALFESGEVDYLVATDAIGMGLNLDIHHVAFRTLRKFDGKEERALEAAELAQVAGRAGRYLRDGTFGTLLPVRLPRGVARAIETHAFPDERRVYYRNFDLAFDDGEALLSSLRKKPPRGFMIPVQDATDFVVLTRLLAVPAFAGLRGPALRLLWEACQIPEYRDLLIESHVDLVRRIFLQLREGPLGDAFLLSETAQLENLEHDEATLLARIADVRTWSYVAHRPGWVEQGRAWRERTAALEDALSMALHQKLVARFVDVSRRRIVLPPPAPSSSALVSGRRSKKQDERPSTRGLSGLAAFAVRASASTAVGAGRASVQELSKDELAQQLVDAPHEAFSFSGSTILFRDEAVGRLLAGPELTLPFAQYTGPDVSTRHRVERRLLTYARDLVEELLVDLRRGLTETPRLRAVAFRLEQQLGIAYPDDVTEELTQASDDEKRALAAAGVEWGVCSVYDAQTVTPGGLRIRHALVSLFAGVPLPFGETSYEAHALGPWALALGYVPWGAPTEPGSPNPRVWDEPARRSGGLRGRRAIQAPILEELVATFAESGQLPEGLVEATGFAEDALRARLSLAIP